MTQVQQISIRQQYMLIGISVALVIAALLMNVGAEFAGADVSAEELIGMVNPSYEPWIENFITPASGEVESFLFALQAAIGSGVVFYILGYLKGKKASGKTENV